MERPFLRFNDYLGLSSIFQQGNSNVDHCKPEEEIVNVASAPSNAWIDRRIEEILQQYRLKQALQNNRSHSESQFCANSANKNIHNFGRSSLLSSSTNSPTSSIFPFTSSRPNSNISSPTLGSHLSSLTNSPMSPSLNLDSSPSWFVANTVSCRAVSPFSNNTSVDVFAPMSSSPTLTKMSRLQSSAVSLSGVGNTIFGDVDNVHDKQLSTSQFLNTQRPQRRGAIGCSFCRNNKEVDDWVLSHQLKDSLNRVMCPILRSYVCPLCFASGDNAHTLGHCPLNPDKRNSSLPLAVRRRTNATGRVKL